MQPRKKPRLTPMGMPDGFEKTSAPSKVKISVPQFTSAFAPSRSDTTAKVANSTKTPHSFLDPQLRNANFAENVKSTTRRGGTHATTSFASGTRHATLLDATSNRPDPFVVFKDLPFCEKDLRLMRQNVDLLASADDTSTSPGVLLGPLRAPQLASILQENEECAAKSMKRIGSPPRLPAGEDTKHNLTISTTSIARFTDINTEGGNAELASIFLDDQHPEMLQKVEGGEAGRGLGFSPKKKRYYGHGPQFVRNGLASRASQVLGRTRTSLILWQREMESQTLPDTLSRLKPDLHMTIDKIESMPAPMSTKSSSSCFGVALCRIHSLSSRIDSPLATSYGKLFKVVFSFPLPAPSGLVRNASRFAAKTEVYAWLPWHEVKLVSWPRPTTDLTTDPAAVQDLVAPVPASFPMPLTLSLSSGDASQNHLQISDTVLLCSRFLFLPLRKGS